MIPTAQDYEDLKATQKSCSLMAGYLSGSTINVTYKNKPQRYNGGYVTEDLFRITGVSPIIGRDFTAADNKPGAEKVVILGYEIWKRDFNGDHNVVGQNVRVNGKAATIIGVMPPNFKFPFLEELWTPLYNQFPPIPRGQLVIGPNNAAPSVVGRLKPGLTLDQANAEFIGLARQLAREYPKTNQNFTSATVQPLANSLIGVQFRQTVWAMLAAVILVLLIACVNVMNMQFGRAALRAKELAIRGALGATRWRLVRQMLTESLVVAVFGTIVGVLLAYWSVDLLTRAMDALPSGFNLPYWIRFTIDGRVLAFIVGITLISDDCFRARPGVSQRSQQCSGDDERRGPRQQQSVGQRHNPASRDRADRTHSGVVDCDNPRDQVDQKPAQARLWLRRGRDLQRPDGVDGRRLYRRWPPRIFQTHRSRIARQSSV